MNYVLQFLALCQSHPAATMMVLGAVASCFVKYLDKFPAGKAFCEALAHAGVNVPGVVNALGRLLGVVPAAVVGLVVSISVAASAGAFMFFVTVSGCTPAQSAADLAALQNIVGDAYVLAGQACVDLADSGVDPAGAKACAGALLVVGSDISAAQGDTCKLGAAAAGLAKVPFPAGTPAAVKSALITVGAATAVCSKDAGAE